MKLHPLADLEDDVEYATALWTLWDGREALNETYKQFPLKVSRAAANTLFLAITAVVPEDFAEAFKADTKRTITFVEAHAIRQATKEFETVLGAELQVLDTYLVSQKGTHSTSDLIERAEIMIPESLRSKLPKQAVIDLQEAGKCLAFNIPTAAAFHCLRATESVIRLYYDSIMAAPAKPKMRNWGAYVKALNGNGADAKITGFIDHLRELYRNPVFHPEDNISSDQAQVFLGACVSLICQVLMVL